MTLHWPDRRSAALTPSMTGMRMSSSTTSGVQQLGLVDRLAPGRGLAHDLDVVGRRRQQRAHPLADDGVVVGDQDPDHSTASSSAHGSGGADVAGRQAHGDRRARRRGRPAISHRRADALAALGHADQAVVAVGLQRARVAVAVDADAVVDHAQHHVGRHVAQQHLDLRRAGMALDVLQRLAHDAEELVARARMRQVDAVGLQVRRRSRCGPTTRARSAPARRPGAGRACPSAGRRSGPAPPRPPPARPPTGRAPRRRRPAPRPRRGARGPRAASAMPYSVLPSESCISRATRARSAPAAARRSALASASWVTAWRSSSARTAAPPAAASGYSAGRTTSAWMSRASWARSSSSPLPLSTTIT